MLGYFIQCNPLNGSAVVLDYVCNFVQNSNDQNYGRDDFNGAN